MKKVFLIVLINFFTVLITSAQFDDRFYFPAKEWDNIENLNYEELFFDIDTIKLNGIFLKPETTPKATILFFHGSAGNISTYTLITKPLVDAGYQVFMIDFRGYGKSTGTPTHINIAHDAQIVFDEIIERDEFKNLPIIIYGASMGTQIATKMAKDNQSKVSGLILDGTISSFTDMALLSAPEEQKSMIAQFVTSPYSAKEDIKEIKNMPKLIIHSKEDKSVPYSQGITVFENASQPKEFWVYEGEHLESAIKYLELFIQKINDLNNLASSNKEEENNTLKITINGLKSSNGKIFLQLDDLSGNKVASIAEKIINNQCTISIDNITTGKYSIYYFHDENNNNELDSKFGIPKEGYGFSNNAKGTFGPPPIEERIMMISENKSIILKPEYLNF
ncbi:MAG: alpha/beta fold hydrolase [Bacteroidales bacterium]|nr:alpha/beta fold hydrolase [Bacteroidales bacterium]